MKFLLLLSFACLSSGFVPTRKSPSFVGPLYSSVMSSVIKGEELGREPFDEGQGGVRLAEESAIKISGTVKHGPGKAEPDLSDLVRYNKITQVDEASAQSALKDAGARIASTGRGTELYKDPGETIVGEVILAPMDAAKDALNAAGSLKDATKVVFNFLGGDDLQLLEVLDAMDFMIKDALDINTKAKIYFNSLSHNSFPTESVTLTVVAMDSQVEGAPTKGVGSGEVYFHDGKWWTVDENDINTAVA
jgi:phage gp36-like protein